MASSGVSILAARTPIRDALGGGDLPREPYELQEQEWIINPARSFSRLLLPRDAVFIKARFMTSCFFVAGHFLAAKADDKSREARGGLKLVI